MLIVQGRSAQNIYFTLLLFLFSFLHVTAQPSTTTTYPDTPPPGGTSRTANLQTFAAGALIIDMGDRQIEKWSNRVVYSSRPLVTGETTTLGENQYYDSHPSEKRIGTEVNKFNNFAYGFVVHCLYNKIPVYWAIRSGKAKDGMDFTATATRIRPNDTLTSIYDGGLSYGQNANWDSGGTYGIAGTFGFRGGPFIIDSSYAARALTTLDNMIRNQVPAGYNAVRSSSPLSGKAKSIVVYQTTASLTVDIRHVLNQKPYVVVSALSGEIFNYGPISQLMENAGLTQGTHYAVLDDAATLASYASTTCVTMFAEPHIIIQAYNSANECRRCNSGGLSAYRNALHAFVASGGNFFAQCAAVACYENSKWKSTLYMPQDPAALLADTTGNALEGGLWLSTRGIRGLGNPNSEWSGGCNDFYATASVCNTLSYPNPDLPLVQFIGNIKGDFGGTLSEFYLHGNAAETDANLFRPTGHSLVQNDLTSLRSTYVSKQLVPDMTDGNTRPMSTIWEGYQLPSNRQAYTATGVKVSNTRLGGMVWYLGSHSYFYSFGGASTTVSQQIESIEQYNGRRLFYNAMLTPATRPISCQFNFCVGGTCSDTTMSNLKACQQCTCLSDGTEVVSILSTCSASTLGALKPCQQCACGSDGNEVITNNNALCLGDCDTCATNGMCVGLTDLCPIWAQCVLNGTFYFCVGSPSASPSVSASVSASMSTSPSSSRSSSVSPSASPSMSTSSSSSTSSSASPSMSTSSSSSRSSSISPSLSSTMSTSPSSSMSSSTTPSLSPSRSTSSSSSTTPSLSATMSTSRSSSSSPSITPSLSPSMSTSPSSSISPSLSPSNSISPSFSGSPSITPSLSATISTSPSSSTSSSITPSLSPSMSTSPSSSVSASTSSSPSSSMSTSRSPSISASVSSSASVSPSTSGSTSITPSVSTSSSSSMSTSVSSSRSSSISASASESPSLSASTSTSPSLSGSPSESASTSPSSSISASFSPSPSISPSISISPSFSASPSASKNVTGGGSGGATTNAVAGATAGIAGLGFLGLLAIGLLVFFLRRRAQLKKKVAVESGTFPTNAAEANPLFQERNAEHINPCYQEQDAMQFLNTL